MCQYANVSIAMQYATAQPIGILAHWYIGTLFKLFFCHVKNFVM